MDNRYGLYGEYGLRYRQSINLFDSAFQDLPEDTRTALLYVIIEHCELARKFDWAPDQQSRQADRDAINESKGAAKHARELARYLCSFPMQVTLALMGGILKSGIHLRTTNDKIPITAGVALSPSHSIRLAGLLTELAEEIEFGNLAAKRGPFTHRSRHGPLLYPNPIENYADLPTPATALAIYLSFLFRKFTSEGQLFLLPGETIPAGGRPHWKLVSQFVLDALRVDGDFKDVASKVLRRHPKLGMVGYRWGRDASKSK